MFGTAIQDAGFGRHFFDLNFSHIQNLLKVISSWTSATALETLAGRFTKS